MFFRKCSLGLFHLEKTRMSGFLCKNEFEISTIKVNLMLKIHMFKIYKFLPKQIIRFYLQRLIRGSC